MEIGIFQLLSHPQGVTDREVIDQALWEADFAEESGYDTIWVTEHHLSEYGLIGVPSVYAAAVAQRTKRIRLAYGVAVGALHHPLRLAEEISWVDHLCEGRLWVGFGPGFSHYEFGAFGVNVEERYDRLNESINIVQGALSNEYFSYEGRFWSFPQIRLQPRPYTQPHPPFTIAAMDRTAVQLAAERGIPPLMGFTGGDQLREQVALYREIRQKAGAPSSQIDEEMSRIGVLRRIHVGDSDEQARNEIVDPTLWYSETAQRVHRGGGKFDESESRLGVYVPPQSGTLPDGSVVPSADEIITQSKGATIAGTPETVLAEMKEIADCGVGHVIAWMSLGNMPYAKVRHSMELMAAEVLPHL